MFYIIWKPLISLPAYNSALEDDLVNIFPFGFFLTSRTIMICYFQKSGSQKEVKHIFLRSSVWLLFLKGGFPLTLIKYLIEIAARKHNFPLKLNYLHQRKQCGCRTGWVRSSVEFCLHPFWSNYWSVINTPGKFCFCRSTFLDHSLLCVPLH